MDSGYELAAQWVGQRYAELCSRAKFRHLRQYGQLYLPAPIQTGTCTITQDSFTVTLDSTALAACQSNAFLQWPDGFTGLWFRPQIGTAWSRIANASAAGVLTLETPFAADNGFIFTNPPVAQAGVTFYIVPRYVELDPTARQIGTMVCDFMYRPLEIISQDQLNMKAPNRFLVSAYPQYAAELNSELTESGYPKQVEIYPWPVQSVTLHYTYWQTPPVLGFGDFIPPTIDIDILRTGAMIDMANNQMGKAIRMGDLQKAAMFRNIANQESTNFEKKINRAIRNDRGAEDLAFV